MGFFSGVTIVSTWDGQEPVGSTVNAFCSVSLSPPFAGPHDLITDPRGAGARPHLRSQHFGPRMPARGAAATDPLTGRFETFAHRAVRRCAAADLAPVFVDCAVEHIHTAGDP